MTTNSLPDSLLEAYLLGECVDQGLHPQGVQDHIYRFEANPQYWSVRRSPSYRLAMSRFRRSAREDDRCSGKPIRLTPAGLNRPRMPRLPDKTVLVACACASGSISPPSWWHEAIEAHLNRLGLPRDESRRVAALTRWIARHDTTTVTRLIDLSVRACLGSLGIQSAPDRTLNLFRQTRSDRLNSPEKRVFREETVSSSSIDPGGPRVESRTGDLAVVPSTNVAEGRAITPGLARTCRLSWKDVGLALRLALV